MPSEGTLARAKLDMALSKEFAAVIIPASVIYYRTQLSRQAAEARPPGRDRGLPMEREVGPPYPLLRRADPLDGPHHPGGGRIGKARALRHGQVPGARLTSDGSMRPNRGPRRAHGGAEQGGEREWVGLSMRCGREHGQACAAHARTRTRPWSRL